MNTDLAPTYQRLFGTHWVLWYPKSNIYSVVESEFKMLLDYYFEANSLEEFTDKITLIDNVSHPTTIAENLNSYLRQCNFIEEITEDYLVAFKTGQRKLSNQYLIKGKRIAINYDSEIVKKTIHPSLAHLEVKQKDQAQVIFDIYIADDHLCLFKDKQLIISVPKRNYHLLQGKFIMHLLITIHNKEASQWLGTFHGSTISDGHKSVLFIGKSGKGKSTLCTLLAANGFELLADDVSPMLSENKHIYHNPSAISIKEGAFSILESVVDNFDELPLTLFNKTKGPLKYVPCGNPKKDHYPCIAIVMVNYKDRAKTNLENVSIKTALETLIPDSWLSPQPEHAKQFLDWLESVKVYQLTYSDTKSVVTEVSELFKSLKKN